MISASALALALLVAQQKPAAAATPPRDSWFGADKLKHFFVAAFTQSVTYSALQAARVRHENALAGAWAVTATVSIAKELHDKRTTGLFSVRDLVWDAAGAGVATALLTHSQRSRSNPELETPRPTAQVSPSGALRSDPIESRTLVSPRREFQSGLPPTWVLVSRFAGRDNP